MNKHQTVHLKGQHTFELEVELGLCNFSFKVIEGKIRINHCSYNPDGGTWLSAPNKGRQVIRLSISSRIFCFHDVPRCSFCHSLYAIVERFALDLS